MQQPVTEVVEEGLRSPLWMVTREPRITRLIEYLVQAREEILARPADRYTLRFRRSDLDGVREAFARMIRQGERKLHQLAELMCKTLFVSAFDMENVVVGEIEATRERFVLTQPLSREVLYGLTDLDLGTRQLRRLRFLAGTSTLSAPAECNGRDGDSSNAARSPGVRTVEPEPWSPATLVANFVEYHPHEVNPRGVHKIISRIKAEEELWNKVVDEIFHLDELVRRDKKLRHLSRFVKDVFGLKVVVGEAEEARTLHDWMHTWQEPGSPATDLAALEFVETKDYLEEQEQKQSGWQAIKTVVRWAGETFEIQVQPMPNYHRERERLTAESHAGFKRSRESLRQEVAAAIPLFGFYQSLLRWLFLSPQTPPPAFNRVQVEID